MNTSSSAFKEWRNFWFLPFAAALGYSSSVIHIYSIGPFIEPLQQEFAWSRAQISMGITIASMISAVFCVPIGMLVDRVGPRRVGLVGVLLMTAAFAFFSTATGATANWIMLWVIAAFASLWVQASVWTSAVASRFHASRGIAFAIALSGASLAATVFPMLAAWQIGAHGWRSAFVFMGGLWAVLVFPMLFLGFRGARDGGRQREAAVSQPQQELPGLTLAEGVRSPVLYKLLLACGLFTFTAIGALVHFVPILKDRGAEPLEAAGIASLIGIFSIIGRLGTGMLLDKLPGHRVGAIVFILPVIAALLLLFNGSDPMSQSIAAAALGLTVGSEVDVIAFLASRHFGLKNFGALYGALLMALSLGTAFGPLTAGAVFDRYGSYEPFLFATMALMAVSSVTLFSIGPAPSTAETVVPAH